MTKQFMNDNDGVIGYVIQIMNFCEYWVHLQYMTLDIEKKSTMTLATNVFYKYLFINKPAAIENSEI